jgi:phosphatidylglycerophosphate synthase
MALHRTTGKPDWAVIKSSDRNPLQKLAAQTSGVITPGNILTLIGLMCVVAGLMLILREKLSFGLILLAFGRLLDIADGYVADMTGTKSPLGENLDAGFDKLATLFTVILLPFASITPWWNVVALFLPQLLITGFAFNRMISGRKLHPVQSGKLSMALLWLALVGLVLLKAVNEPPIIAVAVYTAGALSIFLGFYALSRYYQHKD